MTRGGGVRREPGEKFIDRRSSNLGDDALYIQPHKYREIRKIDMGPIVAAALEAVFERRWRRAD